MIKGIVSVTPPQCWLCEPSPPCRTLLQQCALSSLAINKLQDWTCLARPLTDYFCQPSLLILCWAPPCLFAGPLWAHAGPLCGPLYAHLGTTFKICEIKVFKNALKFISQANDLYHGLNMQHFIFRSNLLIRHPNPLKTCPDSLLCRNEAFISGQFDSSPLCNLSSRSLSSKVGLTSGLVTLTQSQCP